MKVELLSTEDHLVHVQCSESITLADVAGKNPLEDLLGSDYFRSSVLLNLERISYIDTAAIGWFIHCHKACKGAGRRLVLHSIPPMVDQILQLLRMNEVLHLASDEAQARALAQAQGAQS
jgi:anti-anti-sigma factor